MDAEPNSFGASAAESPPRSRGRSRTFSQMATSIMVTPGERANGGSEGPRRSFSEKENLQDRALAETRKLLNHIMLELENRPRPPSLWSACKTGIEAQRAQTKRPEKAQSSRPFISGSDSESEDDSKSTFSPQTTFALLDRLRNLLLVSVAKSWPILERCARFTFDVSSADTQSFKYPMG